MRYIIYGAGAIGGVIGSKLHMAGKQVALIARGEHLRVMQERGLELRYPGESVRLRIPAFGSPAEAGVTDEDVVLLCMKSQDTEKALADLRYAAGDRVPVACVQNGVENERIALRRFSRVYGVLVVMPGSHLEPGVVGTTAWPRSGVLDIGRYPGGSDELCHVIAADLEAAGFGSQVRDDIMAWKYTKLHANTMNAIGAVCGPEADARDLVKQVQAEAEACFRAAGIEWVSQEKFNERQTSFRSASQTAEGAAASAAPRIGVPRPGGVSSSTWQSLARGAGSVEVDFLNGEIVLLGRLYGVPTPANEAFQAAADRLARERRPPGSITPDEMRAEIARRS